MRKQRYLAVSYWPVALIVSMIAAQACTEKLGTEQRQRIEEVLGGAPIQKTSRKPPRHRVPFLKTPAVTPVAVQHAIGVGPGKTELRMESFFDAEGRFLGAQSLNQIDDPRRRSVEDVEEVMRTTGEIVVGRPAPTTKLDLSKIWRAVGQRVDLTQIEEFDLSFVVYRFHDGGERPAVILDIWGPDNPLGMPEELPDLLKDRIRIVYDLKNETYQADNVL